jgi:integrase
MREAEAALSGQPPSPWLFPSPQGGLIRSNNFRDRVWRKVLQHCGLRYRKVHATRHTYATRMIMEGVNPVYVQRQLGHSTIKITVDLYCHWLEDVTRRAVLEVDRLARHTDTHVGTAPCSPPPPATELLETPRVSPV